VEGGIWPTQKIWSGTPYGSVFPYATCVIAFEFRKLSRKFRPVESHSGARETIIAGPYHNLIAEIETSKASRGREHGKGSGSAKVGPAAAVKTCAPAVKFFWRCNWGKGVPSPSD